MVGHEHPEAGRGRERRERPRVLAGAAHQELRRRHQDLREHRPLADAGPARSPIAQRLTGGRFDRVVGVAREPAVLTDHRHAAGDALFEGGGDREGRVTSQQLLHAGEDAARELGRDRLHQDVHVAAAAQAEAPDLVLLVARRVVPKPRAFAFDHAQPDLPDVFLQAATAHAAVHGSAFLDQQLRTGTPVGRAHDAGDRRERAAPAICR